MVYAETALNLQPSNERCLAELLKSLVDEPERVLQYSYLIHGGGTCRYRLAQAEIKLDLAEKVSLEWLEMAYESETDSVAADAGCWLSIIHGDSGLEFVEKSVLLSPEVEFYRSLLVSKLVNAGLLEQASLQFEILKRTGFSGYSFWRTASSLYEASGDFDGAIEASRRAYQLRQIPGTAADLGWKLYFAGRELLRNQQLTEAQLPLREASVLWSSDSLWAVKSDSLLDLVNEFTSTEGYSEPI